MSDSGFGCRLLTIKEAAALLRCSVGNLYRLAERREIVSYRPTGSRILFKPSDLEKFVNAGKRTRRDLPAIIGSKN